MAKKKNGEPRSPRHDELVAMLLSKINENGVSALEVFIGQTSPQVDFEKVETEKPCGFGFADICIHGKVGYADIKVLIEVKTEFESWSAGDVIRQLKGYRRDIDRAYEKDAQIHCVPLGFYCARPLTEIERQLFTHEGVVLLSP